LRASRLSDVGCILDKLGPANIAVKLAKLATEPDDPAVDVLIVVRFKGGSLDCTWSGMDTKALAEMRLYLETEIVTDCYRVWHGEED
jgi:hypothetical protein